MQRKRNQLGYSRLEADMKGFSYSIKKGFTLGLRPESISTRNSELFTVCRNLKVSKAGAEGYIPDIKSLLSPEFPFIDSVTKVTVSITRRWPFPQLFLTDVGLFIGAIEGLYYLQNVSEFELYDFGTGAVTWPWSCIAINMYPAFTCGTTFVYYEPNAAAYVKVT
jgi:hypothetical protein